MSGLGNLPQSSVSGEPGSTGREVFEDSTATGPAAQFRSEEGQHHGTAGDAVGVGSTARVGESNEKYSAGLGNAGQTGGLTGAAQAIGQEHSHHSHHSHHHERQEHSHHHGASGITPGSTSAIGDSYGSNPTGNTGRDHDRVGDLAQNSAQYDRTGVDGPTTGGAAGTDRFDTDKGVDRTGATGNSFGARDDYPVHDTTERAEGKSKGGLSGVLATSDKDFTGRDRTGPVGGAYSDTQGNFQGNTSGPGGNSALTGREGNVENNPVAQAKSATDGTHSSTTGTHTGTGAVDEHGEPHKAGLMEKVKHAVGM